MVARAGVNLYVISEDTRDITNRRTYPERVTSVERMARTITGNVEANGTIAGVTAEAGYPGVNDGYVEQGGRGVKAEGAHCKL